MFPRNFIISFEEFDWDNFVYLYNRFAVLYILDKYARESRDRNTDELPTSPGFLDRSTPAGNRTLESALRIKQ